MTLRTEQVSRDPRQFDLLEWHRDTLITTFEALKTEELASGANRARNLIYAAVNTQNIFSQNTEILHVDLARAAYNALKLLEGNDAYIEVVDKIWRVLHRSATQFGFQTMRLLLLQGVPEAIETRQAVIAAVTNQTPETNMRAEEALVKLMGLHQNSQLGSFWSAVYTEANAVLIKNRS